MPVVINLGTEFLQEDAHHVLWFPDEFMPLVILPPLNEEILVSDVQMEEIDKVILNEEEETTEEADLEVEVAKATPSTGMS